MFFRFFSRNIGGLKKEQSFMKAKMLSGFDKSDFDFASQNKKMDLAKLCNDVGEEYVEPVRDFFYQLGDEYGECFDTSWINYSENEDTSKLEQERRKNIIECLKQEKRNWITNQ